MEVIKAAVMGIAAAMLALYMKSVRPEYSSMISIGAGIFFYLWFCPDMPGKNYRKY